jgi:hypothetical protein
LACGVPAGVDPDGVEAGAVDGLGVCRHTALGHRLRVIA